MRRLLLLPASVAVLLSACATRPAFVVLSIEDPSNTAAGFASLHVGFARDSLDAVKIDETALPINVTVTAKSIGEKTLWVEMRSVDDVALARGTTTARFARTGTPTATVRLAKTCVLTGDCNNGAFCAGTAQCQDEMCVATGLPCVSAFACVNTECIEQGSGEGTCNVTVDHNRCLAEQYCNPAVGCVSGKGCQGDGDCQDGSTCNGVEKCINFVCAAGTSLVVDDADECTVDGCNDAQNPPVFHLALPARDGNPCVIPGTGGDGVCVSSKGGCVASECGDGIIFGGTNESCDDGAGNNSDAWSLTRHCNATCSGWAPFCGDSSVDDTQEFCDAGAANGSGTGCTATCQLDGTCGDGVQQALFEQCDDGDANECNGCRTDCNRGCICSMPGACVGSNWCSEGNCIACDMPTHCGSSCVACSGMTPLCGSVTAGCVCDPSPGLGLRGSCGPGTYCGAGGACEACNDAQRCGQECVTCSDNTPVCGGAEVGCVVDPTTDPPSLGCAGMPDFTPCRIASPTRSYNICIAGICREPGCGNTTCNTRGPSFAQADVVTDWQYPDTNQHLCYDTTLSPLASCPGAPGGPTCSVTTFCGQDAQYGWDPAHSEPNTRWSRTSGNQPVVTDLVSGLIWQGCATGLAGAACDEGSVGVHTFATALGFCDNLVWGGFSDWRVPDYYEIQTLFDRGGDHTIDPVMFPGMPLGTFTTSSARDVFDAWAADFSHGSVGYTSKTGALKLVCIRSGPRIAGAVTRFTRDTTVANQPVVVDANSRLMWQGCRAGQSGATCENGNPTPMTWQSALSYCENLAWGGFGDWHLPNILEIASIIDLSGITPTVDSTAFPNTPSILSWSATSYAPYPQNAWYLRGDAYVDSNGGKTGTFYVRCVRPAP